MKKILLNNKKILLLGNEAIVRGALESGIGFASTYPGTPASEIGDTYHEIAKDAGIYFEYSTNEKVALEAAAGAALSGVRSMVSFKHFGLNVASDSFLPLVYTGVKAGMVVVVADDPGCWSSGQSEQDSRYYIDMAHTAMLEPSNPQECKEFTKLAFQLSEKFYVPVMLRLTTRVSHVRGPVKLDKIVKGATRGNFVKGDIRFRNLPPTIMKTHEELHKKLEDIKNYCEKLKLDLYVNEKVKSEIGIITSGVSLNYIMDALDELGLKIPVLRVGVTSPLNSKKIGEFIKRFKSILVVEELEPWLENKIKVLAKDVNPNLEIFGKKYLPVAGELTESLVLDALSKFTGHKMKYDLKKYRDLYKKLDLAKRFPLFCPGCPHRATFYAAKSAAGEDAVFGGDIGCYILGVYPPIETQDFIFSMGAVQGLTHGIKKVSDQKVIAFIGDSTFFHAGISGLINMTYNKSNPLVIVLDNRITAMTGHQPNPGVGRTGMDEQTKELKIEEIAKACGVEDVRAVDPLNLNKTIETIKELLGKNKLAMIVAKRECQLLTVRRKKREGIKIPKFEIDQTKCNKCGTCLYKFGCPAIFKEGNKFMISKDLCTGCAFCVQLCPKDAIHVVKE